MTYKQPKTLRFWHWWRGGYVRLSLQAGQRISFQYCVPTDEGYDALFQSLVRHEDGIVELECFNEGRDCDGYLSDEASYTMDGYMKKDVERYFPRPGMKHGVTISDCILVPCWREIGREINDANARAAGY